MKYSHVEIQHQSELPTMNEKKQEIHLIGAMSGAFASGALLRDDCTQEEKTFVPSQYKCACVCCILEQQHQIVVGVFPSVNLCIQ